MHIAEAFETGEQPAHVDLEPPKSARHKISGIAVTWDAEHLYFLPASEGVQDGLPPQHIILCTTPYAVVFQRPSHRVAGKSLLC